MDEYSRSRRSRSRRSHSRRSLHRLLFSASPLLLLLLHGTTTGFLSLAHIFFKQACKILNLRSPMGRLRLLVLEPSFVVPGFPELDDQHLPPFVEQKLFLDALYAGRQALLRAADERNEEAEAARQRG
jgi:hypothetical protein